MMDAKGGKSKRGRMLIQHPNIEQLVCHPVSDAI
jgi:hypothetical protein